MTRLLVSIALVFSSFSVSAKTLVSNSKLQIEPAKIDQVIRLADKQEAGSNHKKVSIVVSDNGLSTDVSPRYTVYLGFASLAEMGNISANFKVNDNAYQFVSAQRKAAGIYEVKVIEYRSEVGMVEVTQTIDATRMFIDEQKARKTCGSDFCDQVLNTSVEVTEKTKKQ